jgi:hypothetical protein
MFDMKTQNRVVPLVQTAILAPIRGAATNMVAVGCFHRLDVFRSTPRALACITAIIELA